MKFGFKYIFIFLMTGSFFFSSCRKGIPSDVIQPDKMEAILYDYHVANAIGNDYNGEERYKKELLVQYVFKKHNVTEAHFDSSMVWYTRNTVELNKIYERVSDKFKQANELISQQAGTDAKSKSDPISGDTVNIWRQSALYELTSAPMTNKLVFTIPTDTSYKPRDRYMWKVSAFFQTSKKSQKNAEMELSVRYQNDSTASACRRLAEGVNRLYIQTDTLPIKEVRGFIYYEGDTLNTDIQTLLLHHISLIRYHKLESEENDTEEIEKDTTNVDIAIEEDTLSVFQNAEKEGVAGKEPSRLSPKELREQNRPEKLQKKAKPKPRVTPQQPAKRTRTPKPTQR